MLQTHFLLSVIPFRSLLQAASESLDAESKSAFLSLASAAPVTVSATPAWGSGSGPRIKPSVIKTPVFTDPFTLSATGLSTPGKDGKPTSLGEIMKQVTAKRKIKLEASGNHKVR